MIYDSARIMSWTTRRQLQEYNRHELHDDEKERLYQDLLLTRWIPPDYQKLADIFMNEREASTSLVIKTPHRMLSFCI